MTEKAGIESALGRISYATQNRKVLTVDDQSNQQENEQFVNSNFDDYIENSSSVSKKNIEPHFTEEELEELIKNREKLIQSRKEMKAESFKVPEAIKKRFEILSGIGRLSEDIKVDGITFSIRSLKPKENREAIEAVAKKELVVSQAFENRTQIMARSIYKIDGHPIENVLDSNDFNKKLHFIEEILEESLVNYLYNCYLKLLDNNKKKFDDLGKTEEEVINNVKKS